MVDFIDKIRASDTTLDEEASRELVLNTLQSNQFVLLHSKISTDEEVLRIAELYVNNYSTILVEDEQIYSYQPLHVLSFSASDERGKHIYKGLVYYNGFVVVIDSIDQKDSSLFVLLEKNLCDDLNIKYDTYDALAKKKE